MPERFTLTDSVSTVDWGDVDKGRIWRMLREGIAEGAADVGQAVREVYAVVKADVGPDLTQADGWEPHHEIRDNGDVVQNRGGVIAAAGALAGARAEPGLSGEQRTGAARHLLRHYEQMDEEPPASLLQTAGRETGEIAALEGRLAAGEMRPGDIPLAATVDLAALKADDADPLEVVVEVPEGWSRRRWRYTGEALRAIVDYVNTRTLSGFLGHQKSEDVDSQFPVPVTHWVGALWRDGRAYFRGVVDKAAPDLKRWIRSGRVDQVSIFGVPELQQSGGETKVVGYEPLSIDWTPLGRAGMPTRVVAVGEMDSTFARAEPQGGHDVMTMQEMLAEVRAAVARGDLGFPDVLGEIGITKDQAVETLVGEQLRALKAGASAGAQLREALGLSSDAALDDGVRLAGEMAAVWRALGFDGGSPAKPAEAAGEMRDAHQAMAEAQAEKESAERQKRIDDAVAAKVSGEQAQGLVRDLLRFDDGDLTDERIAGEIDAVLSRPYVKDAAGRMYVDKPAATRTAPTAEQGPKFLRSKRVTI